ncbi:hypothetical protein [Paenibacillus sp. FSL H7-0331]
MGDQSSDISAASAAGMRGIAALWGDGKIDRFEQVSPNMLAYTP